MALVKICGLSTAEAVQAACDPGARYAGFVFYPRSPRHISYEHAHKLAQLLPSSISSVAVMVDPDDAMLLDMVSMFQPDFIQLHGNESTTRLDQIRTLTGCSLIKAIAVSQKSDLAQCALFENSADLLLLDAKTPAGTLPGGMGISFDWKLLTGFNPSIEWILSGGLTQSNIKEALSITHAPIVDVSSGVESSPGVKDIAKIKAFITAASA